MKLHIYALLLVLVVVLTACSAQEAPSDSQVNEVPQVITSHADSQDAPTTDMPEVITAVVCEDEQGHLVNDSDECEVGEVLVGLVEEFNSPSICCRADL